MLLKWKVKVWRQGHALEIRGKRVHGRKGGSLRLKSCRGLWNVKQTGRGHPRAASDGCMAEKQSKLPSSNGIEDLLSWIVLLNCVDSATRGLCNAFKELRNKEKADSCCNKITLWRQFVEEENASFFFLTSGYKRAWESRDSLKRGSKQLDCH